MTNTQLSNTQFNFQFLVFYLSSFWKRWLLKIIISIFLLLFFSAISLKWHSSSSALAECFFSQLEILHLYGKWFRSFFSVLMCFLFASKDVCQSAHILVFTWIKNDNRTWKSEILATMWLQKSNACNFKYGLSLKNMCRSRIDAKIFGTLFCSVKNRTDGNHVLCIFVKLNATNDDILATKIS